MLDVEELQPGGEKSEKRKSISKKKKSLIKKKDSVSSKPRTPAIATEKKALLTTATEPAFTPSSPTRLKMEKLPPESPARKLASSSDKITLISQNIEDAEVGTGSPNKVKKRNSKKTKISQMVSDSSIKQEPEKKL